MIEITKHMAQGATSPALARYRREAFREAEVLFGEWYQRAEDLRRAEELDNLCQSILRAGSRGEADEALALVRSACA